MQREEIIMADTPPTDEQILKIIEESDNGITPRQIFKELESQFDKSNVIHAIQRVLDRGLVELSDGARLVCKQQVAAA